MLISGRRWITFDRDGHPVYLTEERWQHVIEPLNHPEMIDYEDYLRITLQKDNASQEPLNPRKYRYVQWFDDLPTGFNCMVAIVLFGFKVTDKGETIENNYVTTAFLKHIFVKHSRK